MYTCKKKKESILFLKFIDMVITQLFNTEILILVKGFNIVCLVEKCVIVDFFLIHF